MSDQYKIQEIRVIESLPRAREGYELLKGIADELEPLMRRRSLKVPVLREFIPEYAGLFGQCCGSTRDGACSEILIRLRPAKDLYVFRPRYNLRRVLIHELAHTFILRHNEDFYALQRVFYADLAGLYGRPLPHGRWLDPCLGGGFGERAWVAGRSGKPSGGNKQPRGHRLGGERLDGSPGQLAWLAAEERAADAAGCGNDDAYAGMAALAEAATQEAGASGPAAAPPQRKRRTSDSDSLLATPRRKRAGARRPVPPPVSQEVIVLSEDEEDASAEPAGWNCPVCTTPNQAEACLLCGAARA